jgi:cell division protein FtsB
MIDPILNELELQINKLIASLEQLNLENQALYRKIDNLRNENVILLNSKARTTSAIKKLILQLQDELLCRTQK